ncbi:MAG: hypothetical protein ABJA16_10480 [Nakamurella sp.]
MADHQSLGVEARALLEVLAEKLETAASRGGAGAAPDQTPDDASHAEGHPSGTRCTGCPICATLTYLKDHQELSVQLAQGALLVVGAVRQYLEQPSAARSTSSSSSSSPSTAWVQRIDIT